jgi:hypothetical protein
MAGMTQGAPVIVVALANDASDHLPMLTRERKAIAEALQGYEDNRYIRLQVEPNAGIDDLFGLFNRFADSIAILHYAGHASGAALNLETPGGGNETAHAAGLAKLMGAAPSLQLVFLNGCATLGQVKSLIDAGVKAVIATAVPINDGMATEFAEQFYQALAAKKSIRASFDSAVAFIASRYGDKQPIGDFRSFRFGSQPETIDAALTWGLYTGADGDAATGWTLPEQADNQLVIQSSTPIAAAATEGPVNDGLIQTLFDAIAPHSMEVGIAFEMHKRTGKLDMRTVRQLIMDAFPRPVGEQLRKLLNTQSVDRDRLKQLVVTYESVIKLFAFAMLSQLWDAIRDKPDLAVSDDQWAIIDAYKGLDAQREAVFDYLGLVVAINAILAKNGVPAFLSETQDLHAQLTDAATSAARTFLDDVRARLTTGDIADADIAGLCHQAEAQLSVIMADFAFIVGYKLATIKSIAVRQSRHQPPQFRVSQVLLDRVSADPLDEDAMRAGFTEIQSVILLKDPEDVARFLSLTPFVIDQNALTGDILTKLYFHSHREGTGAGATDHYYFISNPADRLALSDAMDPAVKPYYDSTRALVQEFHDKVVRR